MTRRLDQRWPALRAWPRRLSDRLATAARPAGEAAPAESEALLRGIVDSATVAIVTADGAQAIVAANPAACAMFGYRPDQLIGQPLGRLIPERHRDRHRLDMERFGAGAEAARPMGRQRDVMGLHANGAEFPIDAAISHLRVGDTLLYTVIMRDVSERLRAEAALRSSEASLRRLLVSLPEAVLISSGQRISFVNEAAKRLFASDEAWLIGRDPLSLIHPDSHHLIETRIAALLSGAGAPRPDQLKIVRADGAVRRVESSATRVDGQGDGAIVVVMHDVTALSDARQALADSHAELRRLVAAQDQIQENERKRIARELHDDLQQTLAAIRIDLAAMAQRLPEAQHDMAAILDEASEMAANAIESTRRIINDLRPQMLEDLGLVAALEALCSRFRRRTRIACIVRDRDECGSQVPIPPAVATCLYRVAQEALANVAKHARASRIELRFQRTAEGRIVLRIRDDGRGMAAMEPRKPASFGLLGMQERVRAIGATLRVDSATGSGTTIEVHVPPPGDAAARDRAATAAAVVGLRATAADAATDQLLPAVIDALSGHVALLDRQGAILLVNRAWRDFAALGGDPAMRGCGPGTNYLDVCRRSAGVDPSVREALQGLLAVIEGREPVFEIEYPCDSPTEACRFRMHAAPVNGRCVLVTHVLLERVLLRAESAAPDPPDRRS
jgi:PAS domain S-box-containing protein